MDIPLIFALLAAFAVAVYVLADGFDLGVGILSLFAPREADRDLMMASIEPVRDGNEVWLVFGGALLFSAFPAAYRILLPAFYLPIIFMLLALIVRAVAFSFRGPAGHARRIWDFTFAGASLAAAFVQGLILGGFIDGVDVQNGVFHGGPFSFLSVLGVLCGLGLIGGYALMGAGWLIWKVDGSTQVFAREIGHAALILTAAMLVVVSGWTALSDPEVVDRWFSWPNIAWLAPIPLISAAALIAAWRALWSGPESRLFVVSILIFLLGFFGLAVSLWPYIVPRHITIWNGAADPQTLWFVGAGLSVALPIVLAYQFHAYWVFRGKTRAETTADDRDTSPHIWARHASVQHKGLHLS
jgi:cytochrome bd ubiquinol oxidase subunit II